MSAPAGLALMGPSRAPGNHLRGLSLEGARVRMWSRVLGLLWAKSAGAGEAWRSLKLLLADRSRTPPRRATCFAVAQGRAFFALYAPGFPGRPFDRFAANEIERVQVGPRTAGPNTAIFAITTRCGLRCEHCFEWNDLSPREALTSEELHTVTEQLVSAGACQLFLSGGEPMLRFSDLHALVSRFSREADIWVLTAGSGLTAEKAASLREAGLVGVSLSLDHWDPSEHDAFRGKQGTFETARRAALAAREAGLLLSLSLCPTRRFVSEANLRAYRDLARDWGAAFIQVMEPRAVGRYEKKEVELDDTQKVRLERWYRETNALEVSGPSVAYAAYSERQGTCPGAGDRVVYVDTRAMLHPCPFCREGEACLTKTPFAEALPALRARGCGRGLSATIIPGTTIGRLDVPSRRFGNAGASIG